MGNGNSSEWVTKPEDPDLDSIPPWSAYLSLVIYILVGVIGTVGNILTITIVLVNKKLQTIPNVFVVNLAINDLCICAVICPFHVYWILSGTLPSDQLCMFLAPFGINSMALSMFSLGLVAINRYILVVKTASLYARLYTRRNIVISLVLIWVLGITAVSIPFMGLGEWGYNEKLGGCFFLAYDLSSYKYMMIVLISSIFMPMLLVTIACYIAMIRHFRKIRAKVQGITTNEKSYETQSTTVVGTEIECQHSVGNENPSGTGQQQQQKDGAQKKRQNEEHQHEKENDEQKKEISDQQQQQNINKQQQQQKQHGKKDEKSFKIVMNLFVVFVMFTLCWFPVAILAMIDYQYRVPASIVSIFMSLAISNSCINVFIYAGMNRAFRQAYINILTCKWKEMRRS